MSRLWQVVLAALTPSAKNTPERNGTPEAAVPSIPALAADQSEKQPRWKGLVSTVRTWVSSVVRHKMVLLFVGGGLGTIARYLLSKWFNEQPWGQGFPWGTFFINVSGSFILGAAAVFILERLSPAHQNWYLPDPKP